MNSRYEILYGQLAEPMGEVFISPFLLERNCVLSLSSVEQNEGEKAEQRESQNNHKQNDCQSVWRFHKNAMILLNSNKYLVNVIYNFDEFYFDSFFSLFFVVCCTQHIFPNEIVINQIAFQLISISPVECVLAKKRSKIIHSIINIHRTRAGKTMM